MALAGKPIAILPSVLAQQKASSSPAQPGPRSLGYLSALVDGLGAPTDDDDMSQNNDSSSYEPSPVKLPGAGRNGQNSIVYKGRDSAKVRRRYRNRLRGGRASATTLCAKAFAAVWRRRCLAEWRAVAAAAAADAARHIQIFFKLF